MRSATRALGLVLGLAAAAARGQAPDPAAFVPRLSDAAEAMEYWDVTARLDGGQRFVARFLITNEGPGAHTAAAVGHLVREDGRVVPIKYGRTRDGWQLSPDRRRLKIASAVLDLGDPSWRIEIDSDRHGYKVSLQLTRPAVPVSSEILPGSYWVDVVTPTPARGTIWLRGMEAPQPVEGDVALTHTRMERSEAELVQRRAELFGRSGEIGLYLADLVLADGRHLGAMILRDAGRLLYRSSTLPVTLAGAAAAPVDARYPVPGRWQIDEPALRAAVRVDRTWLRWDPLDIVPQPFRFLLGLRATPALFWADADYEVHLTAAGDRGPLSTDGRGIALVAFARPLPAP